MTNQASCKKVFYEVVDNRATSHEYQCETMLGLSTSYESMIERIRSKPKFQNVSLELIQVESLEAVKTHQQFRLNSTARDRTAMQMCLENLFSLHRQIGAPLELSVNFVCKVMGINLMEFVESCGHHRNYLRNTLRGTHKPDEEFRQAVTQKLGIDPWLYSPQAEPVVIKREMIAAS